MSTRIPVDEPNEKLQETLLYVAQNAASDPTFGRTKLHKIIFYADWESYRKFGKTITGATYIKLENGPYIKGLNAFVDNTDSVDWDGDPEEPYERVRLVAHGEPDISKIAEAEREMLDRAMQRFWNWSARDVGDESHKVFGWKAVEFGEEIPHNMAVVGDPRPLTDDEDNWVLEVVEEYREQKKAAGEYCP